eukprot:TRINITY_DN13124_c0_g1_i1.p1 TRINITY_DN13124_c0_g1~~TRINITY_DN13124_c0_g1_i1.p1  ORF type:complete len:735 (+),score=241.77 TRINITY_DN13124_c0_g1_i1:57-2261(+)
MDENIPMKSNIDDDMEEGEISDDEMDLPEILERPQKMNVLPDLLKEIVGSDFTTVDPETVQKISARALRFQTGNAISFKEISTLYQSLEVSRHEGNNLNRLEIIHVYGGNELDLADIQRYFSEYHPLNVDLVDRNTANVVWATAANCARAMLALSKGIGEAGTERVIKHVLDDGEEKSVVTETEYGEDLVHPEDIGIEIPDGGPWRLGNRTGEEGVLLLRFGRKTDISIQERRANARNVGVISKSKREELLLEQQKATQRELELKKPIDKKNPWGIVAERWSGESRGQTGRVFDDYMDSLDKGLTYGARSSRRDWDAPEETDMDGRVTGRGKGSIRDRLDFGNRVEQDSDDQAESFMEAEEEEIDWVTKMKRPRMGMVADLVEKKGSAKSRLYGAETEKKEIIKRKVPNSRYARAEAEEDEEGMDSMVSRRIDVDERVFKTAGRRLTDRFMGGRLEGRVGKSEDVLKQVGRRIDGRLGSKFDGRLGRKKDESDSGDSLERDNGADLQQSLENDLVIQVTQSDEEEFETGASSGRRRQNRNDPFGSEASQENELRNRIKKKEHEKEERDRKKIRDLKEREEQLMREKHRQDRRDREREKEDRLRRKEKDKKRYKKKYSSDDDSETESEESESDSSESSGSESDSSGSDSDSSSSESEEDKKKKKHKVVSKKQKGESRKKASSRSSKSHKEQPKSDSRKSSSKKTSAEELRKAEELRDKLKNYLKKAKEAKENKKK